MDFSGTLISYYAICHRKLWYYSHGIRLENDHENVKIGKMIEEESYSREHKNILINGSFAVDFIEDGKVIHEIKKSSKMEEAHKLQLMFYMVKLNELGMDIEKAVLRYPQERRTVDIEFTPDMVEQWQSVANNIQVICDQSKPPTRSVPKRLCRNCAYDELCNS